MQEFVWAIFGIFLSPWGVLLVGALESSMLFYLPGGTDAAVVIMAARNPEWFWVFPLLAVTGSVAGAVVPYMFGRKVGQAGLEKWVPPRRLKRVQQKVEKAGVFAMGVPAVLPPPFPLWPFILTSGALGLNRKKLFLTIAAMRSIRFGAASVLAVLYGTRILGWLESDLFAYVISVLIVIGIVGTAISIAQVIRKTR